MPSMESAWSVTSHAQPVLAPPPIVSPAPQDKSSSKMAAITAVQVFSMVTHAVHPVLQVTITPQPLPALPVPLNAPPAQAEQITALPVSKAQSHPQAPAPHSALPTNIPSKGSAWPVQSAAMDASTTQQIASPVPRDT
jgi:hypothetical protein